MTSCSLKNSPGVDVPERIDIEVGDPDDEGWRPYRLALIARSTEPALAVCTGELDRDDVERLSSRLTQLLEAEAEVVSFEPVEPAFLMQLSRLDADDVEAICFVDLSFAAGGPGTETGIGLRLRTTTDDLSALLHALSS